MAVSLAVSGWLVIALALAGAPGPVAPSPSADPLEARFRNVWASDTCVQQRGQSWEKYRGWIVRFYSGPNGWTATSTSIGAKITDAAVRAQNASVLSALGTRVAGEWAKDNACRKIRTTTGLFNADERGKPALSTWRDVLLSAAAADSGDGTRIRTAVAQIARQVDAVLGPPQ